MKIRTILIILAFNGVSLDAMLSTQMSRGIAGGLLAAATAPIGYTVYRKYKKRENFLLPTPAYGITPLLITSAFFVYRKSPHSVIQRAQKVLNKSTLPSWVYHKIEADENRVKRLGLIYSTYEVPLKEAVICLDNLRTASRGINDLAEIALTDLEYNDAMSLKRKIHTEMYSLSEFIDQLEQKLDNVKDKSEPNQVARIFGSL